MKWWNVLLPTVTYSCQTLLNTGPLTKNQSHLFSIVLFNMWPLLPLGVAAHLLVSFCALLEGKLCQEGHWPDAISHHAAAAAPAHRGPDRSVHILASHPPVVKGNGRTRTAAARGGKNTGSSQQVKDTSKTTARRVGGEGKKRNQNPATATAV